MDMDGYIKENNRYILHSDLNIGNGWNGKTINSHRNFEIRNHSIWHCIEMQ